MSNESLLTRLRIRLTPQFAEEWLKEPGILFRKTLRRLTAYSREQLELPEKVDALSGMAWKAAEGVSSAQHAKADADYAKAENDRIDAELRRRTLDAKVRQEFAVANKAESEARLSRLKELEARLDLERKCREIGVMMNVDDNMNISFAPRPSTLSMMPPTLLIDPQELEEAVIAKVRYVYHGDVSMWEPPRLLRWCCQCGERIEKGQLLYEVEEVVNSSPSARQIVKAISHVSGILLKVSVPPFATLEPGQVIAAIFVTTKEGLA